MTKEAADDLFSVAGKTALVTGGTSGIGLMIAEGLVRRGARVWISARNAGRCVETAARLSEFGECRAIPADLSGPAGWDAVAEALSSAESGLNILVNNAGIVHEAGIDSYAPDDWSAVMDLDLKAPFFLVQKLLPLLEAAAEYDRPAVVINIGSIGGLRIGPRETYAYAAAKAGLHHLTRMMAPRLAGRNINVNAIAPGMFPSGMTLGHEEELKRISQTAVPRRRTGRPDDIVGTIVYLASLAGAYTTGIVIPVDGGLSI
jgi:NAD(P)-dependent dehydrogenase (short-subunit alcohol dehydrogenase family)